MANIIRVDSASDPRFLSYPAEKYRDDPLWAPPFLFAENQRLNRKKNPFFKRAEIEFFIAVEGLKTLGRAAVFIDRVHNETHGEKTAFFGLFDASYDDCGRSLLLRAEEWAAQRGMTHIRGPVSLTMEEGVGFQINAFDTEPYMLMHYNGPEYPKWMPAFGYEKCKDFYAWRYRPNQQGRNRMQKVADRLRSRLKDRLVVRPIRRLRFRRDLDTLFTLYNQAWLGNWGFRPQSPEEFRFMSRDMRLIFMPEYSRMIELDGSPVAAVLSLPDIHQITRPTGGRLLPFGWLTYLRRKSIFTRARMAIMGVVHSWRNRGLEAILIEESMAGLDKAGHEEGECSWVLEDNDAANKVIEMSGCEQYKTYRLFEKKLYQRTAVESQKS